jgi:hypothetical protein
MAKEPDDLALRLLREIRAKQDTQGATLDNVQKRVEDLYKRSTHTLGVAARAHDDTKNSKRRSTSFPTVKRLEAKA